MKLTATLSVFVLLGGILGAQAISAPVQHIRTNSTYGASLTKGYDSDWSLEGLGGLSRTFTFFDADSPQGGWYYGFGASLSGSAGGVAIVDTWLATLGWMGNPWALFGKPPFDFDLNASVSPTLGSRIKKRVVEGAGYVGVGLSLGFSIPVPVEIPLVGYGAVGISYDPVIPLALVFDSLPVENRGYMNLVLTWTMKMNTESRALSWNN